MKKQTILILFIIIISQSIFSQTSNDTIEVENILSKFISANKQSKDFDAFKIYLCNKNIEVINEKTGRQLQLKKYFNSFNNKSIIIETDNNEYIYSIFNYNKDFGYSILFNRIIDYEKITEFILNCKYKRNGEICIYRIIIDDQDILQIVESNENPAYIGIDVGSIYSKEVISEKLNITGSSFWLVPINLSFGHRITGADPLKGVKLKYGISYSPFYKNNNNFTISDTTTENSFPFEKLQINSIYFFEVNFGIDWNLHQTFNFDNWKDKRWDIFIRPIIKWQSYRFSGDIYNKSGSIEYNFIIQNFTYGISLGFEYWLEPSLRWSSFIDFSYIGKIENTYTNMKIPSSFGLNLGIKYNFY